MLGVVVAVAVTVALPTAGRTLVAVVGPAQSAMSILTPLVGIMLVRGLPRTGGDRLVPTLLTGLGTAAVLGAALFLVTLALVAALPSTAGPARWAQVATLGLGSVLVQCVALLTGTGLGLLIPSATLAFLGTLVIPLGLWRLFGSADALVSLRGWLTQYESARRLLSGVMGGLQWLQFAVMVLIWGVGLNALGAWRRRALQRR